LGKNRAGVWIYLAIEGGFDSECPGQQTQVHPRGLLGQPLKPGQKLKRLGPVFNLPPGVAERWVNPSEQRHYQDIPALNLWPGPQWDLFAKKDRKTIFETEWTVTSQSNRVGYRLEGPSLHPPKQQMLSEPVQVGSIQVPANGQPIVTMRDGPTVGGYPKIGMVDPNDLSRLTQCRPGQKVRFKLAKPT
jgi:allophanate hydrolase subunit 2